MPITLRVENLYFAFPEDWLASKYDDWSYYRNQFSRQFNGIPAVDVLAQAPDKSTYLIEVKDYRHPDSVRPSELPQVIAAKVLMTLAAMLPARLGANDSAEKDMARAVLKAMTINVVAHVELPKKRIPVVDPADLQQKLRRLLRAVDSHPKVVSMNNMRGLPWSVT